MPNRNETTAENFETFQEHCEECIEVLGLKTWNFLYEHVDLEDDDAGCMLQPEDRLVTIGLSTSLSRDITDDFLKSLAVHEVVHTFLGSYTSSAHDRFATKEQLEEKEHEIVQVLVNVLMQ